MEHQRELLAAMPAVLLACEAQTNGTQSGSTTAKNEQQLEKNTPSFELVSIRERV
ncbi:MAG TPA: hypothetical protein VGF56_07070 [Rhizomicrobium sp.]